MLDNDVTNLIPNSAKIKFNVRFNDNFKSDDIIKIIKNRLNSSKSNYELKTKVSGESFFNFQIN